ncbi:MAG: peptidoglycan DD-metalloendopeptidase family protein [Thermoanaerobacteraceae bacterium]|nr:peptidoglycan DD-metalloendopeptidase family protein [Thermoanaerobacteraceae bacterium]
MKYKSETHFTLLVVPEGRRQIHSWRLPFWSLRLLGVLLVSVLTLAGALGYLSIRLAARVKSLQQLEVVNLQQAREIARLKEETQALEEAVSEVTQLEAQVRERLGLDRARPGLSSRGSYLPFRPREQARNLAEVESSLQNLRAEVPQAAARLRELNRQVEEHLAYLEAKPTQWPVRGEITSPFGYRTSPTNRWREEFHDGLDIGASFGTPVRAAGAGTVVFAGWMGVYGRTVIIDHGYGYRTFYGHNSSLLVREGDRVKKGQVIAAVGNTGRSTGPHVHFRLEVQGRPVDPLTLLE